MVLGIEGRQFRPQFDTCCLGYFWQIHLSESHFPHPQSRGKYLSLIVLLRGYSNAQRAKEVVAMCGKEKWPPKDMIEPDLAHCRQIFYQLSHEGSPRILEWVAYPFSRGSS